MSCRLLSVFFASFCVASCATAPTKHNVDYTEQIRGSDVTFDMVWIPAGKFWLGKCEVTWDEYLLYCDFEEAKAVGPGVDAVSKPSKPQEDVAPYDRGWGIAKRPAVGMSWNAAKKYCRWVSLNTGHRYRLPSEQEWLLALAPDSQNPIGDYAWHAQNSKSKTHEVGTKNPNAYGLHDMYGNLWEYCRNAYAANEPERAVLRGGAWSTDAKLLTPRARLGFDPDWVLEDPNVPPGVWWVPDGDRLGFRLLREPEDQSRSSER